MTVETRRVRRVAWVALCTVAFVQAWMFRNEISPDGVAYLDLSDAVVNARFSELVNGYWSPVYPSLIGLLRLIASPTPLGAPHSEFAVVHVANLIGFLAAFLAFEWFLKAVRDTAAQWRQPALESPVGLAAAYALFGIATLDMISLKGPVPDLPLAAAIFTAGACTLKLRIDPRDRGSALMLGAALAVGALTKSILFPLGVVILVTAGWTLRRDGRNSVALASGVFVLGTLPWVIALSLQLGRPSTGETGALNYAWYVNGKQPPNTGVMPALAAPREALPLDGLAIMPDARGTNPLWYDPVRWHRDIRPSLSFTQQIPRLVHSARYYAYVLAPFLLILLSVAAASRWSDLRDVWHRTYVILVPCLAGIAAYSLVYTTSRYIAPFLLLGCVMAGAAFSRDAPIAAGRLFATMPLVLIALALVSPLRGRIWLAAGAAFAVAIFALAKRDTTSHRVRQLFAVAVIVAAALPGLLQGLAAARTTRDPHPAWTTAQRLMAGIRAGSRIAVLGNPENSGWARLARYRIVAVVPRDRVEAFKRLPEAERSRIVQAFQRAGAVQLVEISP